MKNNSIVKQNTGLSSNALPDLDKINVFVDSVENSPIFNKAFMTVDSEGQASVDRASIVANIVLGYEMGISPAASLILGKKLNANSYFSVIKGASLGLDPITSIGKIYNIQTSGGTIQTLAVDIITKTMLDVGCELNYIRDYEFTPIYKTLMGNINIGHKYTISDENGNIKPNYLLYVKDATTASDITAAKNAGIIIIIESGYTHVTSLNIVRKNKGFNNTFHYSIQDAIEAKLHRGYSKVLVDAKGQPLYMEGRDNWNIHPSTMLRNRVTSIAGRIAAADKLQGSYSHQEGMEIINVNSEEELVQAQVIENNN